MLRSMTGIGIVTDVYNEATLDLEIKSVNHRYLDISFRMPNFLSMWEKDFRDVIRNKIFRGKVNVSINFNNISKLFSKVEVDVELGKYYFDALSKLGDALGITNNIELKDFLKMKGVVELKNMDPDEEFKKFIITNIEKALENFITMKNEEGAYLEKDIIKRIEILRNNINEIDKFKSDMIEAYKEKIENNIDKIFSDKKELADEKRLEFEITLYSDKVDVTEEIVRFNSHIEKFLKTIKEEPPVGKKLDFILQEMNREINTIGSKNTLKDISNIVIDSKTTIEKIREQVQNIE